MKADSGEFNVISAASDCVQLKRLLYIFYIEENSKNEYIASIASTPAAHESPKSNSFDYYFFKKAIVQNENRCYINIRP